MVQSSLIGLYTFLNTYGPSFKTHSASLYSQKLHLIYSQLQGKMVILQSKVRIFGQHLILSSQSSFDQVLIMIPQEQLKNHQDAKVTIFGQQKSQMYFDKGITFSWFVIKIPSKAHFEEDAIYYNPSSHSKIRKCTHKKLPIFTLQVKFKSQQKCTLSQRP